MTSDDSKYIKLAIQKLWSNRHMQATLLAHGTMSWETAIMLYAALQYAKRQYQVMRKNSGLSFHDYWLGAVWRLVQPDEQESAGVSRLLCAHWIHYFPDLFDDPEDPLSSKRLQIIITTSPNGSSEWTLTRNMLLIS